MHAHISTTPTSPSKFIHHTAEKNPLNNFFFDFPSRRERKKRVDTGGEGESPPPPRNPRTSSVYFTLWRKKLIEGARMKKNAQFNVVGAKKISGTGNLS